MRNVARTRFVVWLAGLLMVLFVPACALLCCRRWSRVDEFVDGLKCGMTSSEIESYARTFSGAYVSRPEPTNGPALVIGREGTYIGCWLSAGGLSEVQVSWISAPIQLTTEPTKRLCAIGTAEPRAEDPKSSGRSAAGSTTPPAE